ncbi:ester cyclase [Actinomadura sp. ATCC 31491]|uniref:Ester cyclase n=1 Tax=Actinomadura luzonensis TaxID=2805427 RepID=A0ABT0G0V3_9ACTN|nr:ester cyclase [Actinomadura luzonensis]MCK2217768.1 ester cyclase [Actinomadura luzonensis]
MIAELYERWLLEMWNGDFALAHELVTPAFVGHWPGMDVHGPDGLAEALRQGHAPFKDVKVTLDVGPLVDGDRVAARWTFAGTYRGGLPGATAEPGTRIAFSGHDLLRAENGRFAEYWVISDVQTLNRRLGIG